VRIVRSGFWLYDDAVEQPVDVVALAYDFWYEIGKADDTLDEGEEPAPLGPDGCLYYVRFQRAGERTEPTWVDSGGHRTLPLAVAEAEANAPSAIRWRRG
jgi:hypothetical protein